jgi:hypothetical protein
MTDPDPYAWMAYRPLGYADTETMPVLRDERREHPGGKTRGRKPGKVRRRDDTAESQCVEYEQHQGKDRQELRSWPHTLELPVSRSSMRRRILQGFARLRLSWAG